MVFFGLRVSKELCSWSPSWLSSEGKHDCMWSSKMQRQLENKFTDYKRKSSRMFQTNCKRSRKIGHRIPCCDTLEKTPRRIDNGSDNTRFISPQQFFTTQCLQVVDERGSTWLIRYLSFYNREKNRREIWPRSHAVSLRYWASNFGCSKRGAWSTFSFKDSTAAKLHDDIYVDAPVTELKLLKNMTLSFVLDTFETVRDVRKAFTPALREIYRSTAQLLRPYLTVAMSNATAERSFSCLRRLKNHLTNLAKSAWTTGCFRTLTNT